MLCARLPCPSPYCMPRSAGALDGDKKKSAPAHKNQDAGKTEKVPPYLETSFRWAGVSLCIVGLTPSL